MQMTMKNYMFGLQVMNLGKPLKSYGTVSLNIQWPKESATGKWLLYLVKITSKGLEQITCSPENEINPISLTEVRHPRYSSMCLNTRVLQKVSTLKKAA